MAPKPIPPTLSSYADAVARTSLALIVRETRPEDEPRRVEAIERSASEALQDILTRYLRSLGNAARAASNHACRSESNIVDLLAALNATAPAGVGLSPAELLRFLEDEATEVAFPVNVAAFPVQPPPLSAAAIAAAEATVSNEPRPPHLSFPDKKSGDGGGDWWFPNYPEKRTYSHTAVHNERPEDGPAAKKRRAQNRLQATDTLLAFSDDARKAAAESSAAASSSSGGAAAASIGAPPPLLPPPAMPDDEEVADGDDGGASALRRVPDVLVPSFPAVLQSSAKLETSGLVDSRPAFGQPAAAGGSGSAAAAAEAVKMVHERVKDVTNERQKRILTDAKHHGGLSKM